MEVLGEKGLAGPDAHRSLPGPPRGSGSARSPDGRWSWAPEPLAVSDRRDFDTRILASLFWHF